MTRAAATGRGLVLAALVAVALACGDADDGDRTTIRFWGLGREGEVVAQLVPEFERLHPDIRVDVQQMPWTAAHEKMLTAFVGEATPDIAQLGNTWVPEFAALGALAPLDSFVLSSSVVAREGYFDGIWRTNVVDGTLYGVPWYVDTRALFYRTDLLRQAGFDAPPRTWDEWRRQLAAVRRLPGTEFGALLPIDEWAQPVILGLQAGATLLDSAGRQGDFQDPRFRRAFDYYLSLFRDSLAPAVSNTQVSNVFQEFERGRFVFWVTGPWNVGEMQRRLPASLQDDWAVAPLPGPDGAASGVSTAGGSSVVIFARSERQDAAWRFVEYLSRPETQRRFWELTGDLPARRETWEIPALAGDARLRAFGEQLARTVPTPAVPEWELIAQRVAQYAEQAARGRMTSERALAALDAEVDAILEKRRWVLDRALAAR